VQYLSSLERAPSPASYPAGTGALSFKGPLTWVLKSSHMTVYVDHAFAVGDWGRWTGGGHLQADTPAELHEFAGRLGLRREWFQSKRGRPEKDHYDLTQTGRERAITLGALSEDRRAGTRRRQAVRLAADEARRQPATSV
jgi:hypothetical protein